jgi:preprotein translocase subunit YajC
MFGLFLSTAYGQTAAASKPSIIETLFPFAIILVLFYLFAGRPQQKKFKEQQNFLSNLKKGDQVITAGGIHGEITGVSEKVITLQVADNVRIKVVRSQIQGLTTKEGTP